jgi:aryl-alcohol dehydrogenase-like predicted oxidoreductase
MRRNAQATTRRALEGRRDKVFLQVKFGALRGPDGAFLGYDNRPAAVRNFIAYSLFTRGIEREVFPAARPLGVGFTAYGVLSPGSRPKSAQARRRSRSRGWLRGERT